VPALVQDGQSVEEAATAQQPKQQQYDCAGFSRMVDSSAVCCLHDERTTSMQLPQHQQGQGQGKPILVQDGQPASSSSSSSRLRYLLHALCLTPTCTMRSAHH
jgi:hypothetical protein